VRKLAEHYPQRSLKQLTERQVFDYLIFRRDEQKLRPSTLNQAVVALRLFYQDFLQRDWQLWRQFEIRRDYPLPVVLTRDETRRLLGSIRKGRFRAVLTLIHHWLAHFRLPPFPSSSSAGCGLAKRSGFARRILMALARLCGSLMGRAGRTAKCRLPRR